MCQREWYSMRNTAAPKVKTIALQVIHDKARDRPLTLLFAKNQSCKSLIVYQLL
jgi:hypothetical protein